MSYFEHCPDDGAHHISEESVGFDGKYQLFSGVFPVGFEQRAIVCFDIGVQLGKAGEVGVFKQDAASFVHFLQVGKWKDAPRIFAGKGVFLFVDIIFVGAREGGESGVHIGFYGVNALYGNIFSQQSVEFIGGLLQVFDGGKGVEVCDEEGGVYAGVCPSSPDDVYFLSEEGREGVVELFLHGDGSRLYLPAVVGAAVVG